MLNFLSNIFNTAMNYSAYNQQRSDTLSQQNYNNAIDANTGINGLKLMSSYLDRNDPDSYYKSSITNNMDYYNSLLSKNSIDKSELAPLTQDFISPYLTLQNEYRAADTHDMVKDLAYNGVQRRVEDLKKAGLSPILAAGDAASSAVTSQNASGNSSNIGRNSPASYPSFQSSLGSSSFGTPELVASDIRLRNAQARKLEVDADAKEGFEKDNVIADTDLKKSSTIYNEALARESSERIHTYMEQINLSRAQQSKILSEVDALIHNNNINLEYGIRSQDNIPFQAYQLQGLLTSLGIDTNSQVGQALTTGLMIYMLSRGNAPFISKKSYKIDNHYNNGKK